MTEQKTIRMRMGLAAALAAAMALSACGGDRNRADKAPVDYRGSTPGSDNRTATTPPATTRIVESGGARYVYAQSGDTVATLAERHGISASELAGYNGLTPDARLQNGQDLVLPPGAGQSAGTVADAGTGTIDRRIEERPLEPTGDGGVVVADDGSIVTPTDVAEADTTRARPDESPEPIGPPTGWNADIVQDAIKRSETGLTEDGRLAAPPSSGDPVPETPTGARDLESPGLGQYQTDASAGTESGAPATTDDKVAAADATGTSDATRPALRLVRPVDGPVAVGFGQGAGTAKNDGVDFAAPAGAPVVAAADGEVALVSDTLGGLGTIVLVRHADEILTVYGRIDKVTVKKGDIVRRGQRIGVVSNAAAPAEPRMHFEVRRGATVLDPMQFL